MSAIGYIICGLLGIIAGGVIILITLKNEILSAIVGYTSEVTTLREKVKALNSRLNHMGSLCDVRHAQGYEAKCAKEKLDGFIIDFHLGHKDGMCDFCGSILYKDKLLKEKTPLGEIVKCYNCGAVLS